MGSWLQEQVIKLILEMLSEDKIEEFAEYLKATIFPWIRLKKDELIVFLKAEAEKTGTPLDDIVVEKLEDFLDAFLPDNAKHL